MQHIVVANDGSEQAWRATDLAAQIAAQFRAKLSIVHVLIVGHVPDHIRNLSDLPGEEQPELVMGAAHVPPELPRDVLVDIANKLLAQAQERAENYGVTDIETAWLEGATAECIVRYANEHGADMVVMGSRGLSDLKGIFIGSVSHKVLQLYEGNVLTFQLTVSCRDKICLPVT
jgi:nucleotide-binding universal stress UspA family protein